MSTGKELQSSIRDLLNILFRHKKKIVFTFLATVIIVTALAFLISPIYESDAKIMIRLGRDSLAVDMANQGTSVNRLLDGDAWRQIVETEIDLLTSRELIDGVIDRVGEEAILTGVYTPQIYGDCKSNESRFSLGGLLGGITGAGGKLLQTVGLSAPQTAREKAIAKFSDSLYASAEPNSNSIWVRFEHKNKCLAHEVLTYLIADYKQKHIEVNAAGAKPEFFTARVAEAKKLLDASEAALEQFRNEHGITTIDDQQEHMLIQITELENEQELVAAEAQASRARVAELESAMADRDAIIELSRTTGRHNFAGDALKEKLLELKVQEAELADRFVDTYPALVSVRKQIKEAEAMLSGIKDTHTEVTTGVDISRQDLGFALDTEKANLKGYEAKQTALLKDIKKHKANLELLAQQEVKLQTLERNVTLAAAAYEEALQNKSRSITSQQLDREKVSNVSIVEGATLPIKPIRPRKDIIIPAGILLAFLLSFAVAYTYEYFDDTFRTDADVEKWLGVPVLASVSEKEFNECT